MKTHFLRRLLCGYFSFCACFAFAQTDFSKIDDQARQIEFSKKQNIAQLATALTASLTTDTEKARAIFVWITANIRYDAKLIQEDDVEPEVFKAKQRPLEVLRSKRAVCEGYANLFTAICQSAGLKSLVVTGLTKTRSGRIPKIGHAWNVVRVEDDWKLIDATWGSGSLDEDNKYVPEFNEKYFFSEPKTLVLNHFPSDPLFQLLEKPMDLATFKLRTGDPAPAAAANPFTIPNAKDSLDHFSTLDSSAAGLNSALRILRFDPTNSEANLSVAFCQFEAANQSFMDYWTAQKEMMEKQTRPTLEQLKKENEQMVQIQRGFMACQQTIGRVPVSGRDYRSSQTLQRAVATNLKTCQEVLEQNQKMQIRLKGKG
ncbi:MAG: transglutaminase domain-containing protein [Saprospiraceae bacterium]